MPLSLIDTNIETATTADRFHFRIGSAGMNLTSEQKVAILTQGYAFALCISNWKIERTYDRDIGVQLSTIDLRWTGAVSGCVLSVICMRRLWAVVRQLFANGITIPANIRVWGRLYSLTLLFPMLVSFGFTNGRLVDDGVLERSFVLYGGGPSFLSAALAALAILSFQAVVSLEAVAFDQGVRTDR